MDEIKELNRFIDGFGFIVHGHDDPPPYDGGDAAQRTFTRFIAIYITDPQMRIFHAQRLVTLIGLIKRPNGEFVRHPDPNHWWGQLGTMSWDNLIAMIICLNLYHRYSSQISKIRSELFWTLIKRLGFLWNVYPIWPTEEEKKRKKIPDNVFVRPLTLLAFMRGVGFPFNILLWPIIAVLDVFLLLDTIARLTLGAACPDETGDHLNFQLCLIHAQCQGFSPIAWFCRQLYGALLMNPLNPKTAQIMTGYAPYNIWEAYFWDTNNHPPMYLVMHPVIKKYL